MVLINTKPKWILNILLDFFSGHDRFLPINLKIMLSHCHSYLAGWPFPRLCTLPRVRGIPRCRWGHYSFRACVCPEVAVCRRPRISSWNLTPKTRLLRIFVKHNKNSLTKRKLLSFNKDRRKNWLNTNEVVHSKNKTIYF
jgi:hypothetical protein